METKTSQKIMKTTELPQNEFDGEQGNNEEESNHEMNQGMRLPFV